MTLYSVEGDTTVVPLPAAGWLMLAGLGGLAALRRRKRAA
ncbi:VPLPA-CTERM sorting domain-containing protein [Roseovarius tibetensis]